MTASIKNLPSTAPTSSNTKSQKTGQQLNKKNKSRAINPRKLELIELSHVARDLIDSDSDKLMGLEDISINSVIKHVFYPAGEYRLFKEWKADGLCVRKGEKGYAIWGRKRKMTKKSQSENDKDKEYQAFPLAYIFHESQVEQQTEKKETVDNKEVAA